MMLHELTGTFDRVKLIKISSKYAQYLDSQPSPFVDKPSELPNGTIGRWDSCPIVVDDTIDRDFEIVWKNNKEIEYD